MKNLVLIAGLVLITTISYAADLSEPDAKLFKKAGIPIYDKAIFVYGNSSLGFRFATSDSPESVQKWYKQQLPSWSVYNEFGIWVIYNGKPGLGGKYMEKNNVFIQTNDKLPEWYSLDKKMTTEVIIMVVQ